MNGIPKQFKNLLITYNPKLSESSIKTRWSQYKTICKNIGIDATENAGCSVDFWNNNMELITKFIENLKTTDSKLNYTVVAVVIIKALIMVIEGVVEDKQKKHAGIAKDTEHTVEQLDELESIISTLTKQITQLKNNELYYSGNVAKLKEQRNKEKEAGEMTQKQKDNYIPFDELQGLLIKNTEYKLNELMEKEKGHLTINDILDFQGIVLCRLMLVAPSRTDFGDLQIIRSEEEAVPKDNNYLYLVGDNKYIQLNKWKTKKSVGSFRRIQLNTLGGVEDIILRYCYVLPTKKHMFENFNKHKELKAMSASAFSKYVTSCFKKYVPDRSININLLRHIIITYHKLKIQKVTELQNTLGHGSKTQGEYIFNVE